MVFIFCIRYVSFLCPLFSYTPTPLFFGVCVCHLLWCRLEFFPLNSLCTCLFRIHDIQLIHLAMGLTVGLNTRSQVIVTLHKSSRTPATSGHLFGQFPNKEA